MGMDPTEYDYTVFRITSEISKQVFPLTLDIDNPRFRAGMERLRRASVAGSAAAARGGLGGRLARAGWAIAGAAAFVGLYFLPVKHNDAPAQVRLAPAW